MTTESPESAAEAPDTLAKHFSFRHIKGDLFTLFVHPEAAEREGIKPFAATVRVSPTGVTLVPPEQVSPSWADYAVTEQRKRGWRVVTTKNERPPGAIKRALAGAINADVREPQTFDEATAGERDFLLWLGGRPEVDSARRLALGAALLEGTVDRGRLHLARQIARTEFGRDLAPDELRRTAAMAAIFLGRAEATAVLYEIAAALDEKPEARFVESLLSKEF